MTTMTSSRVNRAPEFDRSLAQRRAALNRANAIRRARADLKRDLTAGRVTVHVLILDPPEYLATMKVAALLLAMPKVGKVRVKWMMASARIASGKTVGGLSVRQRDDLVSVLS